MEEPLFKISNKTFNAKTYNYVEHPAEVLTDWVTDTGPIHLVYSELIGE